MLTYNALRFTTDTFTVDKQGLLISKVPLDATAVTSVTGFTITGSQPDNTDRRVAFLIDDELKKFSGSDLVPLSGETTFDNIIANGNSVTELNALTNIPAFVGHKIYPVIALKANEDASDVPSIKLTINAVTNTQQLTKTVETADVSLPSADGSTPQIVSITASDTCTASGSVAVSVSLSNNGTWGDFVALEDAAEQFASAVKFRVLYSVDSVGNEHSAKLNSITIRHSMGETVVRGEIAELYSVVQNYEADLQTCYLIVRHQQLTDSTINAYVAFAAAPKYRELINIGTGTGTSKLYALSDTGIHPSTLKIFADGKPITNFGYSTNTNKIRITAASGAALTASYEYDWEPEVWHEMTRDIDQQFYSDGNRMTRFSFSLPDDQTQNKQVSNVRIVMTRPTGEVVDQSLGSATGKVQQVVLPHPAVQSSIQFNADWSYDADDKILTFVAPKGTALTISYGWLGEQPAVYSWAAGWNAAV